MTAAAVLLSLLSACASAPPAPSPQYASADPRNGDGLGGTGITVADVSRRGDGIGGTGILGTITGFSSIIVNGLKLEFNNSTSVAADGRPASLQDLRVGQVVEGIARTRDGKLTLDALDIQHAVTGPISAVDQNAQTMVVLGQKIRLNLAGDRAAVNAFKTLQAGDVVSVSGLRMADGTIVASRVDEQHDDGRLVVRGDVTALTSTHVRIGTLEIPLAAGAVVSAPQVGGRVLVSGRMINGEFAPQVISGGAGQPFGEGVSMVSLEAYAPVNAGSTAPMTVHGVTVPATALPAGTTTNDPIVVSGRIDAAGKIDAASIAKVRTAVTVLQARGSLRPATIRPDVSKPDRVAPPFRPERPQAVRPIITRPDFERPQS